MKRTELPPSLKGAAFRTVDARAAGVARDRLDASDLFTPFHGVRAPTDAPRAGVVDRCRLLLPRLGGLQFFSHTTAAALWTMLLPRSAETGPLHVAACPPARAPRTAGVVGHRTDLTAEMLTLAQGIAYRRYRVCVEYDGRQHAEHAQFIRDADRWAAIEAEGWIIVRVLAHHLTDPPSLVARVERALRSRGWSTRA